MGFLWPQWSVPWIMGFPGCCWCLKSQTTTWDVWNPTNNGKNYLPTGAGFQPSTVPKMETMELHGTKWHSKDGHGNPSVWPSSQQLHPRGEFQKCPYKCLWRLKIAIHRQQSSQPYGPNCWRLELASTVTCDQPKKFHAAGHLKVFQLLGSLTWHLWRQVETFLGLLMLEAILANLLGQTVWKTASCCSSPANGRNSSEQVVHQSTLMHFRRTVQVGKSQEQNEIISQK